MKKHFRELKRLARRFGYDLDTTNTSKGHVRLVKPGRAPIVTAVTPRTSCALKAVHRDLKRAERQPED